MKESDGRTEYFGIEDFDDRLEKEGILIMHVEMSLGDLSYGEVAIPRKTKGLKTIRVGSPFLVETEEGEQSLFQALFVYNPKMTQIKILAINLQREKLGHRDLMGIGRLRDAGWSIKSVDNKTIAYRPRINPPDLNVSKPAA